MRLDRALDRFIGDMARRNYTARSRRDYYRHLVRLFERLPDDPGVGAVTPDAVRACLDGWADASASTRYKVDAMFRAFAKWLYANELVDRNPMDRIPRPKRPAPDEVPLRAISGAEVRRMFDACRTVRELLCLSTVAYLGSRRGAAARLRWGDVDLAEGWATLQEKGAKIHTVALPDPYLALLRELVEAGAVSLEARAYVGPDGATAAQRRRPGRSRDLADRERRGRASRRAPCLSPPCPPCILSPLPRTASRRDRSAAASARPLADGDNAAVRPSDGSGAAPEPRAGHVVGHPVRG